MSLPDSLLSWLPVFVLSETARKELQKEEDALHQLVRCALSIYDATPVHNQSLEELERGLFLISTVDQVDQDLKNITSWQGMLSPLATRRQLLRSKREVLETSIRDLQALSTLQSQSAAHDLSASRVANNSLESRVRRSSAIGEDPLPADLTPYVERLEGSRFPAESGSFDTWEGDYYPEGDRARPISVYLKKSRTYSILRQERLHQRVDHEILRWVHLRHPNVLPFLGTARLGAEVFRPVCFVSPWVKNGNIMEYLATHKEVDKLPLIQGIIDGVEYLHGRQPPIFHGRIKGTNVLITSSGSPVLSDYGIAVFDADLEGYTMSLAPDWVRWAAPEFVDPSKLALTAEEAWVPAADIFSLGMTIYEVLFGIIPFATKSSLRARDAIPAGIRPEIPDRGEDASGLFLIEVMKRCWAPQPQSRPTAQQLADEFTLRVKSVDYSPIGHDESARVDYTQPE
ncbi:kinase-like protein [Calocera cornea HHB12733]|uniref:Kinase-like protein n=1 Tax=Calocera cornea HHB12733 TaxID=1353952 RepID=A0A165G2C0_9BASI|nr:kinase-like protein [Calocera cornea HHB12733]